MQGFPVPAKGSSVKMGHYVTNFSNDRVTVLDAATDRA